MKILLNVSPYEHVIAPAITARQIASFLIFAPLFVQHMKNHQKIWWPEARNNLQNCAAYSIYSANPPAFWAVGNFYRPD
jgi:hypothetical protein